MTGGWETFQDVSADRQRARAAPPRSTWSSRAAARSAVRRGRLHLHHRLRRRRDARCASTGRIEHRDGWATALLLGCVIGARPPRSRRPATASASWSSPRPAGFRHDSIPDGIAAVKELGEQHGFTVDATEDAGAVHRQQPARGTTPSSSSPPPVTSSTPTSRRPSRATSSDGGGYVGVHAAADTEYDWPFYGGLAGAYFDSHPAIQPATVEVEDHAHPATAHLARQPGTAPTSGTTTAPTPGTGPTSSPPSTSRRTPAAP